MEIQHTLFIVLNDTSPGTTNQGHPQQANGFRFLGELTFIIFLLHHQEYAGVTIKTSDKLQNTVCCE
jgi:hypothetical protein